MKNKDIDDRKIETLFDHAFDFQAPLPPKYDAVPDNVRELDLSELDMLSAAGEKTVFIDAGKKRKPDRTLENE